MVVISACQSKCGEGCFKSNVDRQGKPTFALPTQIEQTRNARIIRTIGNGDWVDAKDDHSELERRLHNGMMSNAMKKNAIGLAEAHAGFQNFPFSDTICNGIEGLIRG
jgi:hypothetical protein